jgi:hypothetical protein
MPIRDMLELTGSVVTATRSIETPDGMGGVTVTTTITGLPRAALWSPSQSARYISDKMARVSTHILITEPADYTFTDDDDSVNYNGKSYKIVSPSDDIMEKGEIMMTGLEKIT